MKLAFRHIALKQFYPVFRTVLLGFLCITNAWGQSNLTGYKDVSRQRLLVRITAHYIYTISQGQIDMDSAIRIPCKLYGLSPLLPYNEGYSDGKPSPGTRLLDLDKVAEAKALLVNLRGENRVRLLIELAGYFIFKPGTARADLDMASKYLMEAEALSESRATKWKIEVISLRAHLLDQSGLLPESQKTYAQVVKLCERSGNRLAAAQASLRQGGIASLWAPRQAASF